MKKLNLIITLCSLALMHSLTAEEDTSSGNQVNKENIALNSRPLSEEKRAEMEKMRSEEELEQSENQQPPSLLEKMAQLRNQTGAYAPAFYHFVTGLIAPNVLQLEDSSQWSFDIADSYILQSWLLTNNTAVKISPKDTWFWTSNYSYVLTNMNNGNSININPSFGPEKYGLNSYWVIGLNYQLGQIYLVNGRGERCTWIVASKDMYLFNDWKVDDTVIIGDNTNWWWWFSSYGYILINVNMNHYIRAKLL